MHLPGGSTYYDNLANYALALQRFDEARQDIREMRAQKVDSFIAQDALYALAFLGGDSAAQGAEADAARVRARAAYKDFLSLWKDADPDVPVLKEAKAEYEKVK